MVDTLIPFLAIVIAVQMAGVSNENTQFGMAMFFGGLLGVIPARRRQQQSDTEASVGAAK